MFKKIVVFLGFNLALLAFFDIVLNVSGILPPKYWYGNESTGFGFGPNAKGFYICEDYPGGKFFQSRNSYGFKEVEETLPSFPGIRALFLGDSHMNGVCENDETISSRFESMASIKFDFRVDAQNGAFGGFSPAQYARVILYESKTIVDSLRTKIRPRQANMECMIKLKTMALDTTLLFSSRDSYLW